MPLLKALLLVGLLASGPAVAANLAGQRFIMNCSASASDNTEIAECVLLAMEQAESQLVQIEQRWQQLLDNEGFAIADVALLQDAARDATAARETENAGVIAIVNDTALREGANTNGTQVINIDNNNEAPGSREAEDEVVDFGGDLSERFGFVPALFRSYRDQHCKWQATMFGIDRKKLHYQACLAALSQHRAQMLSQALATQRAYTRSGQSFRGFYAETAAGAVFQACDRKTDWWVTGDNTTLAALNRRYADINTQSVASSNLVYMELRGNLTTAPVSGLGADYRASIEVRSFSTLRPVVDSDCATTLQTSTGFSNPQAADDSESNFASAATVDDFASSGFFYGYFNNWLAACSVTENSVCSAETEAQFASDGAWLLRVDRSLEGDWRILLIPTTDDQVIEKQLTLQINGADVYPGKSYPRSMRLVLNQGVGIADGDSARELVAKLKLGRELRLQWFDDSDVMSELKFSLLGVTQAVEYFDSNKP